MQGKTAAAVLALTLAGTASAAGSQRRHDPTALRAGAKCKSPRVVAWNKGKLTCRPLPTIFNVEASGQYTLTQSSGDFEHATETAHIILAQRGRRNSPEYLPRSGGFIKWQANGTVGDCSWTSEGTRAPTKYELYLLLSPARPQTRASFSAQDELVVSESWTCKDGQSYVDPQGTILHPFFHLGRLTAGVAVSSRTWAFTVRSNGYTYKVKGL